MSTAGWMTAYLLACQCAALAVLARRAPSPLLVRDTLWAQSAMLVGFYLVFGGHGVDALGYLTGFDGSPFVYHGEWLFYGLGHLLNQAMVDPWPLRVLSAVTVALLVAATLRWFDTRHEQAVLALAVLAVVPAFFFVAGNAVRQGLAAALLVYVAVRFGPRPWILATAALAAWCIHQPSLLLVAAMVLGRLPRPALAAGLALAPAASLVGPLLLPGLEIDQWLRYAGREEGQFHFAKFFVGWAAAWAVLVLAPGRNPRERFLHGSFVAMVAISAIVLRFEVPFERSLAFAEFIAPLVVPPVLARLALPATGLLAWGAVTAAGLLLWNHASVQAALGFS